MYRYFSFLLILFLHTFNSIAQSHRMRAGINLGVRPISTQPFNDFIIQKNGGVSHANQIFEQNFLHSYHSGLHFSKTLFYGMVAKVEIHNGYLSQYSTEGALFHYKHMDYSLLGNFYLFRLFNTEINQRLRRNSFMELAVSYQTSTTKVDTTVISNFQNLAFTTGVGYDFYVSEKISLTPTFRVNIGLQAGLNTQFTIQVGYTIFPENPLCPIKGCAVRQEHRHAQFGGYYSERKSLSSQAKPSLW